MNIKKKKATSEQVEQSQPIGIKIDTCLLYWISLLAGFFLQAVAQSNL
jgi:hypothetical protein